MIVIVEGIDRVGKTTLKDYIKTYGCIGFLDFDFHKLPLRPGEPENMKLDTILHVLGKLFTRMNIVIDRLFLSEYVYGLCSRGYENVNLPRWLSISKKLGIVTIFVYPTNLDESSKQHGKDLSKHQETFEKLYEHMKKQGHNVHKCDYSNMKELWRKIVDGGSL